jgi:hypothetical protein
MAAELRWTPRRVEDILFEPQYRALRSSHDVRLPPCRMPGPILIDLRTPPVHTSSPIRARSFVNLLRAVFRVMAHLTGE